MTFDNAAWAIDGATVNSALARTASYSSTNGEQGVTQFADLKVTQLGTPGQGLLISEGSATILNGYQDDTDQAYTVTNPAAHTVPSASMPASNPSAQSYILAIVIGDPEFSQVGHPWMGASDPAEGTEDTFQYVRPTMIQVSAGATDLGAISYPALPLARIDIPANTTTVTDAMITDLRSLARPRSKLVVAQGTSTASVNIIDASWRRVTSGPVVSVKVPKWATRAKIMGFVEGMRLTATANAKFSVYIESNNRGGENTNVNENLASGNDDRRSYNVGADLDVSDLRDTVQNFSVRAQATDSGSSTKIKTDTNTTAMLSVYFEEAPI